ncbi:MAG TPA: glycosyltransferase family 4 protein [Bryobacteraceae bacterium]|nr:glycosyltransferase family 4 protein [Bryobacteraceae bacterium]
MKTLHVDTGREMGGGQWQALYLMERLTGAALLAPEASPLMAEARARGIEAHPLSAVALARMARESDLVHAHDARAHTLAAVLKGARLVVARRVAFPVNRGLLSRVKYARADLYLAVSRCVAAQLEQAGVEREKIRVVYDGVPLVGAACGDQIVALGSKNVDLIRRASEIAGVEVRFTTNLWDDLSKAKMFLYASGAEGLGSAALAAMSAGVPVIASRVGGLPEAVEHERTGILAENRPEDFADAITRLLRDPELAREMGRRGRERVERMFTIEGMVRNTVAGYDEVCG